MIPVPGQRMNVATWPVMGTPMAHQCSIRGNARRTPSAGEAERCLSSALLVGPDDVGVAVASVLDDPLLRRVVDVDQAEAGFVAVRPLEIVEQGPGEVPGERHAALHGPAARREMPLEVTDPFGVVHGAVVLDGVSP